MSAAFLGNHKVIVAATAIIILGGSVWAVIAATGGPRSTLPKDLSVGAIKKDAQEDPHAPFERVHEAARRPDLTDEQRHELFENLHAATEERMNQRLDKYFAANASQRKAILDRQIDEMQSHMREREQARAERERANTAAGTSGQQARGAGGAAAGAPGGGPGPGGIGPDGRRHGPPTQEERKMRSESRDPDQMARRMAYFTALRKRAEERGIQMPAMGPPRGPGGR